MKKFISNLFCLFSMIMFNAAFAQSNVKVVYGESVENIMYQVDKLLRDSLNPNIEFKVDFASEVNRWLDLKISVVEKTGQIGTAHMYSRIIGENGLHMDLILQGVKKNIDKINSGDFRYHVGTNLSGLPDFYYALAVERNGISYFVYCFD